MRYLNLIKIRLKIIKIKMIVVEIIRKLSSKIFWGSICLGGGVKKKKRNRNY